MALLSSPKKGKTASPSEVKPVRVPIKMSAALVEKMRAHHKPKEKSAWVADAIQDLLDRELYRDANWEIPNDDTEAFMALLNFKEKLSDPKADTFLLPAEIFDALSEAVERITKLYPSLGVNARPALIRAAIRQRLLLSGGLLSASLRHVAEGD